MTLRLTDSVLRHLFKSSHFILPEGGMVFFALRGMRPVQSAGSGLAGAHDLEERQIDHRHMHCTIGQWLPAQGLLSVFRGSSVPHEENVRTARLNDGKGTNKLCSGWFAQMPGGSDYRFVKGHHGSDRHLAFRNERKLPVWRTVDDVDYDGHDRFEAHQPVYDNLHCARTEDEDAAWFSSNGCVVVAGRPGATGATAIDRERGPWRWFLETAYGIDQRRFPLAVFEPGEALQAADGTLAQTLRFGSSGPRVFALQSALTARGFDVGGAPDRVFGPATAKALHRFQLETFGPEGTDLICGPRVFEALGLDAPVVGLSAGSAPYVTVLAESSAGATEDPTLEVAMDTDHRPLPGWRVIEDSPNRKWSVTWDGRDVPVSLGSWYEYTGYPKRHTRGLARTASTKPGLVFRPEDWTEFDGWADLIQPLAVGESSASFTVVNCWDHAAITFGFTQLAAHTGDDLLPFFLQLADELPMEFRTWFPELEARDGRLAFRKGNRFRFIDKPAKATDGGFSAPYYHGQLMRYFNPDRFHDQPGKAAVDTAELHATARWVVWTLQSPAIRRLQVVGAIRNFRQSLDRLHATILAHPPTAKKHPRGIDGMRCDVLAVSGAALHLGDKHLNMVLGALRSENPADVIRLSGYGPGDRAETIHKAMKARPRLTKLIYDRASAGPVPG